MGLIQSFQAALAFIYIHMVCIRFASAIVYSLLVVVFTSQASSLEAIH